MSELTLRFGEARLHVEGDADLVARERAAFLEHLGRLDRQSEKAGELLAVLLRAGRAPEKAEEPVSKKAEPEEPAQKPAGLNPAILLAVLALMGGGGAFAYFKLVKSRPKTKGNDNLDDYDYGEDDTDQEDEDSWETEESDEPDADGGGDEESEDKTV